MEKTFDVVEAGNLLADIIVELPISAFKDASDKAGLSESQVTGLLNYLFERGA